MPHPLRVVLGSNPPYMWRAGFTPSCLPIPVSLSSPSSPPDTSALAFGGCYRCPLQPPITATSSCMPGHSCGNPFSTQTRGAPTLHGVLLETTTGSQSLPHIPAKSILLGQKHHQIAPPLTFFGDFPLPLDTISEVPLIRHAHCPPCTSDSRPLHAPSVPQGLCSSSSCQWKHSAMSNSYPAFRIP